MASLGTVVQALTGTINNYSCINPGSQGLVASNGYAPTGNTATAYPNGYDWPTPWPEQQPHRYCVNGNPVGPCVGTGHNKWDQAADGIITTFGRQIRFGLMMDDDMYRDDTDWNGSAAPGTSVLWGPTLTTITPAGGSSYYFLPQPGGATWKGPAQWYDHVPWDTGKAGAFFPPTDPGAHFGLYAGEPGPPLKHDHQWELGARNPDARPWQGRLMGFGTSNDPTDFQVQNGRLSDVIRGTGPQNPTLNPFIVAPVAPLMSDAADFLLNDNSQLANYPGPGDAFELGPKSDPNTGCRLKSVVFISSGVSNGDMRSINDGFETGPGGWGCNAAQSCPAGQTCNWNANFSTLLPSTCSGANCNVDCQHFSNCEYIDCTNATSCNVQCHNHSDCFVDCTGAASCNVSCSPSSSCRVLNGPAITCGGAGSDQACAALTRRRSRLPRWRLPTRVRSHVRRQRILRLPGGRQCELRR